LRVVRPGLALLATLALSSPALAAPTSTLPVPMRDGVELATDVYLPDGAGPFPVIVMRTPYEKSHGESVGDSLRSSGIATVVQDTRGRFGSQGVDCIFRCDGEDGFDTLAWVEQQAWCNDRVVTWGGSALGIVQYMAAVNAPPVLDAMWADVATPTGYDHMFFQGGALRQSMIEGWLEGQGSEFFLQNVTDHPLDDGFWDPVQTSDRYGNVVVPAVHYGGWYDIFGQGTIDAFVGYQHQGGVGAKGKQKLVMGPWTHGVNTTPAGELTYPNAEGVPGGTDAMLVTWLLHHLGLQPDPSEVDAIPTVQYYVMGDVDDASATGNEWRVADDWPVPAAPIRMHLQPGGELAEDCPPANGDRTSYVYDPTNPSPTTGGANLLIPAGPFDQTEVEARPDVITFTTPALVEPQEITGRVRAYLWVDTDVVDTDVVVRMTDVYPDGRSMLVLDGVLRLGYRNGASAIESMVVGQPRQVSVDLWSTSIILNAGHRLRISITSSNAPRFWPNPNDGTTYGGSASPATAHVSILHDADHPSFLEVPNPQRSDGEVTVCESEADAGTEAGLEEAGLDAPSGDDSGDGPDAGSDAANSDAGLADGSTDAAPAVSSSANDDGGCGCRTGARRPSGWGWLALVGLAFVLGRTRRTRLEVRIGRALLCGASGRLSRRG
jgi:uncharacterized protein